MINTSCKCGIFHKINERLFAMPDEPVDSKKCLTCKDRSCASLVLLPEELAQLGEHCTEAEYSRNEPILKEGSPTSSIIYLRSGLVKEFRKYGTGREHILSIIKSHAYLGLPSLFGDRTNQYSYTALTEVKICSIDLNEFKDLVLANGRFAYEILATLSRESLNNYHRLVNKQQKQISGKIADTLLYFARNIFESNQFSLPLSRNEIAFLIGTGRESVTKQLNEFATEGLIRLDNRDIELLEISKLEQISRFG